MLVIISTNSNKPEVGWTFRASATVVILIIMFLKNLAFITTYTVRRYIDNRENPQMRPHTSVMLSKVEMEAFAHIQSYLIDPHDDGCDNDGNTSVHQMMRLDQSTNDWNTLVEHVLRDYPHQLFMLNKMG